MTAHSFQAKTRLTPSHYQRLRTLSQIQRRSMSQVVRTSLIQYLEQQDHSQRADLESIYAAQLRASTNRICALLAKSALDSRAVYLFLGDLDDSGAKMRQCRDLAAKQITANPVSQEGTIAQSFSQKISGAAPLNQTGKLDEKRRQT